METELSSSVLTSSGQVLKIVTNRHKHIFPNLCPICGGAVVAHFTGWAKDENDLWKGTDIEATCMNEPEIDDEEFDDWFEWHYQMPYGDWLPLTIEIMDKINKYYRYNLDH